MHHPEKIFFAPATGGSPSAAGMCVALRTCVMRLSELTIIYFATAAPFGVASFLGQPTRGTRRVRALSKAAGAAIIWPLTALLLVLERVSESVAARREEAAEDGALDERRIERSKRELTNALREVEDVLDEECPDERDGGRDEGPDEVRAVGREARRFAMFSARECVERYVGLALACVGARKEANPSERELELCRLAGGAGDDLLLAGRCIHRRNVTRLFAHRERARAELIHALAGVREETGRLHTDAQPSEAFDAAARRASEALVRALARAVELLSLLEDEEAARRVARLLDAECARLRRLEVAGADEASEDRRKEGAQTCTTQAAHRAFATPLLRTTTSRHG